MNVSVQLRKADSSGNVLRDISIPAVDRKYCSMPEPVDLVNPLVSLGPTGCLRVSHRALDKKLSSWWSPEHHYSAKQPLRSREVVELDMGLWQTGIRIEPGKKVVLKVLAMINQALKDLFLQVSSNLKRFWVGFQVYTELTDARPEANIRHGTSQTWV